MADSTEAHNKLIKQLNEEIANYILQRREQENELHELFYNSMKEELRYYFLGEEYDHRPKSFDVESQELVPMNKILSASHNPCPVKYNYKRNKTSLAKNCINQVIKEPLFIYDPCFQESIFLATKTGDGEFFKRLSEAFKKISDTLNEKIDKEGLTKGNITPKYKKIFIRLHVNQVINLHLLAEDETEREQLRKYLSRKLRKIDVEAVESFKLFKIKEEFKEKITLWSREVL